MAKIGPHQNIILVHRMTVCIIVYPIWPTTYLQEMLKYIKV